MLRLEILERCDGRELVGYRVTPSPLREAALALLAELDQDLAAL